MNDPVGTNEILEAVFGHLGTNEIIKAYFGHLFMCIDTCDSSTSTSISISTSIKFSFHYNIVNNMEF